MGYKITKISRETTAKVGFMGIQEGIFMIWGTVGDKTYYKRKGKYLYRKKTSLNKERFETDCSFEGLRKGAGIMGNASRLALVVYKRIGGHLDILRYRQLVSHSQKLIREGNNELEVGDLLALFAWEQGGVKD